MSSIKPLGSKTSEVRGITATEAFDALPDLARDYVYRRLRKVPDGEDRSERFAHLAAVLEIPGTTKNDFADYQRPGF